FTTGFSKTSRLHKPWQELMEPVFFAAERAGFEPAVRFDPHTAFPVPHLRPLGHLSGRTCKPGAGVARQSITEGGAGGKAPGLTAAFNAARSTNAPAPALARAFPYAHSPRP